MSKPIKVSDEVVKILDSKSGKDYSEKILLMHLENNQLKNKILILEVKDGI